MKQIFFYVILVIFSIQTSAEENFLPEEILTPSVIFHKFPICKLRSSLGQWCKTLSNEQFNKFVPSMLVGAKLKSISNIRLTENNLHIEDGDSSWFYTFSIEPLEKGIFQIQFIDDGGKGASYFAIEFLKVLYSYRNRNW